MLYVSHILTSVIGTSLFLNTTNTSIIFVSGIASLFPDIDTSNSIVGRTLFPISNYLERRLPHRSATHSILASVVVTAISYTIGFVLQLILQVESFEFSKAFSLGYTFGWIPDMLTRNGVEMFWPYRQRCVFPRNRQHRLKTGSTAEYFILGALICLTFITFNINSSGGALTNFNRILGSVSGVEQVFNQSGATNLVFAQIQGVYANTRNPVKEKFTILKVHGSGFIVEAVTGEIYKAGTEGDVQIITEKIVADIGKKAITNVEQVNLQDENMKEALSKFEGVGTKVYVSGVITIDDPEGFEFKPDLKQFPFIRESAGTVTLEVAPINIVKEALNNQFATGQLQVRRIVTNA